MFQTYSEPVTLREGVVGSFLIIKQTASVIKICDLRTLLFHELVGAVVKVVSSKVHISIKQSEGSVQTSHPCVGDSVVAAPSAHSATHSTASPHILHHASGNIIETTVVSVVAVKDYTYLAFVSEPSHHGSSLISPVIHVRAFSGDVMSSATHYVSEPALHHSRSERKVDNCLFLSVIDSCELRLIRLLLNDLYLLDDLCRNVLGCKLRIVKEECLSVYGYLLDGLSVGGDGAVSLNLHTRKFLEKFLKHVVVRGLEGRSRVFYRILLDDDGISHCRDLSCIEGDCIIRHPDCPQIHILFNGNFPDIRLISHEFNPECIGPLLELCHCRISLIVSESVLQGLFFTFDSHGGRCKGHRLACLFLNSTHLYGIYGLSKCRWGRKKRH